MSKPTSPESEMVQSQRTALQTIVGGAEWNTSIGKHVYLTPRSETNPPSHIYRSQVETEANSSVGGVVQITWTAIVRVADDDDMLPELALADMRAALLGRKLLGASSEVFSSIGFRETGSDYAVVQLTIQTHAITR